MAGSMEPRLYQGQALRVRAARTALTETNLPAHPECGKGDGAAGAHPLTSGGAPVTGLFLPRSYPQILRTRQKTVHVA